MTTKDDLLEAAKLIRNRAYVPYSAFPVGAALRTKSGNTYTGCNIENAAYPVSCCAERVAIFQAIANGERDFAEMAVVADTDRPVPPCGSCRQVMSEFFKTDMIIHLSNLKDDIKTVTMEELLPFSFQPSDLTEPKA
ncbi:cytidine deaminase [Virgibacillus proomii]|jgi:cytidine deaminase|uniref:cytidine deaminase n=1 Tax=Virgibacillus proomii TaxID=84407 RepID=UPI000986C76A|nr:cytidine deaminase [Virgibacillus proomii]